MKFVPLLRLKVEQRRLLESRRRVLMPDIAMRHQLIGTLGTGGFPLHYAVLLCALLHCTPLHLCHVRGDLFSSSLARVFFPLIFVLRIPSYEEADDLCLCAIGTKRRSHGGLGEICTVHCHAFMAGYNIHVNSYFGPYPQLDISVPDPLALDSGEAEAKTRQRCWLGNKRETPSFPCLGRNKRDAAMGSRQRFQFLERLKRLHGCC